MKASIIMTVFASTLKDLVTSFYSQRIDEKTYIHHSNDNVFSNLLVDYVHKKLNMSHDNYVTEAIHQFLIQCIEENVKTLEELSSINIESYYCTTELIEWLASNIKRVEYCNIMHNKRNEADIIESISYGQQYEYRLIQSYIVEFLSNHYYCSDGTIEQRRSY